MKARQLFQSIRSKIHTQGRRAMKRHPNFRSFPRRFLQIALLLLLLTSLSVQSLPPTPNAPYRAPRQDFAPAARRVLNEDFGELSRAVEGAAQDIAPAPVQPVAAAPVIPQPHTLPGPVAPYVPVVQEPVAPLSADDVRGLPDDLVGKTELTALRTADSATFDMGDGTYALVQDTRPMHYQDNQGNWLPINPAFATVENGWINNTNSLNIGLSPRSSDAKIGVAEAGVGWEPQSLVAVDADGQTATLATVVPESEAASSQASADGRSVRYTGNWSDPALQDEWHSGFGSAEYTMRLSSLPSPDAPADSLELCVYLHLRPGTTLQAGGEPVSALDLPLETRDALSFVSAGGDVLWLQPPQAHEQRDPSVRVAGDYRLTAAADPTTIELRVRVPWDWLAAEERRFPVVIDPLFQMRSGTIVRAPGYEEGSGFVDYYGPSVGLFRDVFHGYDVQIQLLMRFATPTQPPDTEVTAAYLIAVPTGGGASAKMPYLAQRVEAYELDQWTNPHSASAPVYNVVGHIGTQWMSCSAGDPTNADRGVIWDVTNQVQKWLGDPYSDHGIMLKAANEFCDPNPIDCGGFVFDENLVWTMTGEDNEIQQIEDLSTAGEPATLATSNGGVRLMVFYRGPTLSEGEVIGPDIPFVNFGLPDGDDPYFHADHEYRLEPLPDHWQAVVARGIGETEGEWPPHSGSEVYKQHLQGSVPLELRIPILLDMVGLEAEPNDHLSYVLLNGRQAGGDLYNLRVKPQVGEDPPLDYDIRLIGEKESIVAVVNSTVVLTYGMGFDSNDPLALWNIDFGQLPSGSNVRVNIEIYHGDPDFPDLYEYARGFSAQLFEGGSNHFLGFGDHIKAASNAECNTEYGGVELSGPIFTPDTSPGDYALVLAYNGPGVTLWKWEPPPLSASAEQLPAYDDPGPTLWTRVGGGESPRNGDVKPMTYSYRVRVTSCSVGKFPTKYGTCQEIRCPTTDFPSLNRRNHGGLQLWSENGWDALPMYDATSTASTIAPMIGAPGDVAPSVAVVGGQIAYFGTDSIQLAPDSLVLLVDCNTLEDPTSPVTGDHYFQVYTGKMERTSGSILIPTDCGAYDLCPWRDKDKADVSAAWFEVRPLTGEAHGGGDLRRSVEGVEFSFDVSYWVDVGGYPSLDYTITRTDANTPPTIASLILALGDTFSLDVTPPSDDKTNARYFQNVRASNATISQPSELGGATKPVQALILGVGIKIPSDPERGCGDKSCIDLRALDDAYPEPENRNWQMPDVHTNVHAGTVMFRTRGKLQIYSVDHPAAVNSPQSISQEFSFDTFGGSVSVGYEPCEPGGPEVTVIRGETQLMMPNIGAIGAGFKLCESTLRSVHFEFYSPVGVPLANSGLFLTGMNGQVDIFPDYTQIKFGLNFQTGDGGSLFRGYGDVTIDTRGMFAFQGAGEILGLVDVDGSLWVAWNPLDVGFNMNLAFDLTSDVGLEGSVWAHMWEGQGWQHRYHWLPDNDEKHMAAQIAATFYINQGAAFSWWFIDIPPFDISFGIEVAFGEFCTNASCISYEWGVKGKFVICGFDIGMYFGFDHGIDFILGNDDHVLIDQYGGAVGPFQTQYASAADRVAVRAASPAVNGVSTETLQVSPDAENLLVALGWQAGAPELTLYDPDGTDVTVSTAYTVAISTTANSKLMGVQLKQSKPGDWQAVISSLTVTGTEHYKFIYFANKGAPGTVDNPGRFLTPGAGIEDGSGVYTITWEVPAGTPVSATTSLYYTPYMKEGDEFGTVGVEQVIVQNWPFSAGSYVWDTSGLKNWAYPGEKCYYGIRAVVDDGVNDFPAGSVYDPSDPCQTRSELPSARAFDPNRFPGLSTFSAVGKIVVTDTVAPGVPTGLELEGVDGAILARWDPSPEKDLAAYLVRWGIYKEFPFPYWRWYNDERVTAVLSPTLRLGGLISGTTYQVAIKAIDVNGNESAFSSMESATPTDASMDPVPLAPISLTLVSQTSTYVHFSWSPAATGATPDSYRLAYQWLAGPSTASYTETVGCVDTTLPTATVTGLQTGATYRVSVSAANSEGWCSASSDPITVTVTDGVDDDGDGLPDDWATAYAVYSSTLDADGDGLENGLELSLGTVPTVQDSDGDDFSDWEEQAAGTDPLDSSSFPAQLTQPRLALDTNHLVFYAKKGDPEPVAQFIDFSNTGGGILMLNVDTDSTWINPSVQVPPDDLDGIVLVDVDTSGLQPGYYSDVVRVDAGEGSDPLIGGPHCIRVEIWVSPADTDIPSRTLYLPLVVRNASAP